MHARVKNRTLDFNYKKEKKIVSKLETTYNKVSILEPTFGHFFQIKKYLCMLKIWQKIDYSKKQPKRGARGLMM